MLVPVGSQTLALGMDWSLAMSKGEVRTRWTLWRTDPFAWAADDRTHWFPAR